MSEVATSMLRAISADPASGLDLAVALINEGRLSLFEPAEGELDFGAALVDMALKKEESFLFKNGKVSNSNKIVPSSQDHHRLFKGLFIEGRKRWARVEGSGLFARKEKSGKWAIARCLEGIEHRASSWPDKAPFGLDEWLRDTVASLPDQAVEECGGQMLATVMRLGMSKSLAVLWKRVSPIALDQNGVPAILSASTSSHWMNFIKDGGDPRHVFDGRPLWRNMFDRLFDEAHAKKWDNLRTVFERWILLEGLATVDDLHRMAQFRARRPVSCAQETWVEIFRQSQGAWSTWTAANKKPLWRAPASAYKIDFFRQVEAFGDNPELICSRAWKGAKMEIALNDVKKGEKFTEAIRNLEATVKDQGWFGLGRPYFFQLENASLNPGEFAAVRALADGHEDAWWGVDVGTRAEKERELFKGLRALALSGKEKSERLYRLAGRMHPQGSAWGRVWHGILGSWVEEGDRLFEIAPQDVVDLIRMGAEKELEQCSKIFRKGTDKRDRYDAWFEGVRLEASTPASTLRSGPSRRL